MDTKLLEAKMQWEKYKFNMDEFIFFHELLLKNKNKDAAKLIGSNAANIRKANNFAVSDLHMVISANSIYKKEYGERFFTPKDILKLADANNVHPMSYYVGLYIVERNEVTPDYARFDIIPDEQEVYIRSVIRRDMDNPEHKIDYIANTNFARSMGETFVDFCNKHGKTNPNTQSLLKRLGKNIYFAMSIRDVSLKVFDGITPIGSIQKICTGFTIPTVETHLLPVSELLEVPLQVLMTGMWKIHQGRVVLQIPASDNTVKKMCNCTSHPIPRSSSERSPQSAFFDNYPMFTALRELYDSVAESKKEKDFITEVMSAYLDTFRKH